MNYKNMYVPLLAIIIMSSCQHHSNNVLSQERSHENPEEEHHSPGHKTGTLEVTSPISKDTFYYNEYVSQIQAFQRIELKSLEKGYLSKIFVDEGQLIQKGQLLFEIQPTIYQAEIKKAEAELAQAKAEREKAFVENQNTKALTDNNIVSDRELALTQAELKKSSALVENAKAELALSKAHFQFTKIRAPFSGITGRFEEIRTGSLLEEGEQLTTLTDNSKMWVYFNIPESVYLNYKQYPSDLHSLNLKLANNQIFDHQGKITAIQAEFDNTTGTIPFRATFENPNRLLRHGQTGKILWPIFLSNAMLIPQKATFEVLEKRYVFLVDEDGTVSSREIKIEAELDNLYVVSDGLTMKDKFLIEGIRNVKEGQEIDFDYISPKEIYHNLNLHAE